MWPSVVGQARFLRGSAGVHASTGRRAGEDLAFERHLAGADRSPLSPPQTSSGLERSCERVFTGRQPDILRLGTALRAVRL